MLEQQVSVSTATLLTLIRRHGAEPHTVLSSTAVWEDERARRAAEERADGELARLGLYGHGAVHPGLLATVAVIARPAVEYYAWINGGIENQPVNYTVLAGAGAGEAFVLVRNSDSQVVALGSVHPAELLDNFVAQLPRLGPGRGRALRVPKSALAGGAKRREFDGENFAVMSNGRRDPAGTEVAEMRRILGLPRLGGGSLYVASRGRGGRRERAEHPVNYIDTAEGRWLTEEVPGSGEPVIAFHPASPNLLVDRLRTAQGRLPVT
ncbi:ESX secretion-associated protein EspG [Saccharomonospora piscinae]|uniref:ESX secretion-associated protein EspG n=1 Tax=Saccharomonospora piscinae TaxID=687388 RepID=A0A1V9A149_SACPI|nr:ESX secretion-associated protein EspG [Saccharomonospora piscinae]OQO90664.1 ESX secretion-associated protein EspG [Saccharomonospora piscinae]TLW93335.1 ESX secretion-associated protein EspG [Saccharomonospora piscinae]